MLSLKIKKKIKSPYIYQEKEEINKKNIYIELSRLDFNWFVDKSIQHSHKSINDE